MWYGVDPLAEKMPSYSPYVYTFNNPVRYTDPTGMAPNDWVFNWGTGKVYWNNDAISRTTVGANETYLGKSGFYTSSQGIVSLHANRTFSLNFSLQSFLRSTPNLDPVINPILPPTKTNATISRAHDTNSAEWAMTNSSGRLALAGLDGLKGGTSAIATEFVAAKTGLTFLSMFGKNAGFAWSSSGSAGGLEAFGVQSSFKSVPYGAPTLHPRLSGQSDIFHSFDNSLIPTIMNEGSWSQRVIDGSSFYQLPGTMKSSRNLYRGNYEIGVTPENVIFHKSFKPIDKTKL